MQNWVNALKEYASITGHYVVPKKGTDAYTAVRAIYDRSLAPPEPAKSKRGRPKKAVEPQEGQGTKLAGQGLELAGQGTKLAGQGLLLAGEKQRPRRTKKAPAELIM